ncbi:MAG: TraB/GumN family protein [Sphingomonadales bacterium]|jgi:uncharacterized protein YbaP (TraB family)|uniref:TraB/GumN family protein n=2 Tax=Sphingorhabdus sp. TaxID=1902408 RepID=UPI003BAF08CC|nr:TraB/GumN family protein [Sphingomonadales bacterium]MBK9431115.1 TraB/GumN family protein [Sphingomonadales bacterium]MBL0021253.1 TraB/GumN family protein [Sphingomonadales bacterium]
MVRQKLGLVWLLLIACITTQPLTAADPETPSASLDPVPISSTVVRDADPALWVVRDDDTTIYLFGTIHILKPGLGWFDEAVKEAFDKSDTLVLELVEPPADEAQAMFAKFAIEKSGKPLRSRLSGADLEAYDSAMAKIGMPKNGFDPFKPWAAGVTLQMMGLANSGYDPNSGVETQLTAAAKASGKPIIGVETMEGQLAIFDNLPEANQLRFLNESSAMADQLVGQMDGMVELWAKPDPDGLARLMNDGLSDPVILAELLTLRNARWAYWIKDRMQKPGTMFMAVGAGHLAGGASVQHLLGAYGLSVERIQY